MGQAASGTIERKGLWVPCEGKKRPLEKPDETSRLLKYCQSQGVTDVFLQVFRGGRSWFPSVYAEFGNEKSNLASLLEAAKNVHVRVHAWINVCNLGSAPSDGFLERVGGGDALLRDNNGMISADRSGLDTPGTWLEPSNPLLREALKGLVSELGEYDLAGLHLDFIRYPYCLPLSPASWIPGSYDFGYSESALKRFTCTGHQEVFFNYSPHDGMRPIDERAGQRFDSWRRAQITELIRSLKDSCSMEMALSAAILPWADRAYLNSYQDLRSWLQSGLLDFACLMTYTADSTLFSHQLRQATAFAGSNALFAGIANYKLRNQTEVEEQIAIARSMAISPCIFSYEDTL